MFRSSSHRRSARRGAKTRAARPTRRMQRIERLESRLALSSVPLNAQPLDTGEFMLGDVSVTVVFFESDGSVDPNTENWNTTHANEVKQRIEEGLQWWVDTLALQSSVHELNFEIDYTYADNPIQIGIEPITRVATDLDIWVGEFLDHVGAERSEAIDNDVRLFNHSQRVANETDWAFTIFVINAQNDANGLFAPGSVQGAFSIAGGSFIALPSRRPASTLAHEVSHQFWAMDEYAGSGHYDDTRGYYNTQNTNAVDGNPAPGTIETSLLGHSAPLVEAYNAHISSTESFESIGWKDSDGDGIFDVFDVPISFSASSQFDPNTNRMRISGNASIGVLPNLNSWGLQNSITINRLSHIEFRLDGGAWQTGPIIDDYTSDFDFLIQLADSGEHEVEVRIVDETGHIHSDSLVASTVQIDSTDVHGFTGYITYDQNGDGIFNAGEQGLAGWMVEVVDMAGNPEETQTIIEPDDYSHGEVFYDPIGGVTLVADGSEIQPGFADVAARNSSLSSTGSRGFYNYSGGSWSNVWSEKRQLRISFNSPVSRVAIDATAEIDGDVGILELYDSQNNLLGRYTTSPMAGGTSETMVVELDSAEAAYAIARGHLTDTDDPRRAVRYVALDNLQVGRPHTVVTNELGAFTLPFDIDGNYRLRVTAPDGKEAYFSPLAEANVSLTPQSGTSRIAWSVSIADDSWHNPLTPADVNHDGNIDSGDFDLILTEFLNPQLAVGDPGRGRMLGGNHSSGDPYIDINMDGRFDNLDLLSVLDAIAWQSESEQAINPEPTATVVFQATSESANFGKSIAHSPTISTPDTDTLEGEPILPSVAFATDIDQESDNPTASPNGPSETGLLHQVVLPSQDLAIVESVDDTCDLSNPSKPLDDEAVDAVLSDLDASLDLL
ncbi:dockerin type I domain-containing protein [Bremerella sp.]|uniref:dockerin type I domain-containing protein n=1 Tax=Bremerella sp. TaxID=2795602 RepID=UPI0039196B60